MSRMILLTENSRFFPNFIYRFVVSHLFSTLIHLTECLSVCQGILIYGLYVGLFNTKHNKYHISIFDPI